MKQSNNEAINQSPLSRQTTIKPSTINHMQESNRFVILLKEIWPTIHRGITNFFYFLFGIVRTGVKLAIQQLKGGGIE